MKMIRKTKSQNRNCQYIKKIINLYQQEMRNIRKQFNYLATLIQTILHQRLEASEAQASYLNQVHKKISFMNLTQCYQQAVTQMLIEKQTYQIKSQLTKFVAEVTKEKVQQLQILIYLDVYQKSSGDPYNSELWQFQVEMGQLELEDSVEKEDTAFVQVVQFVINNLRCFGLIPGGLHNRGNRNKFIFNHTIKIQRKQATLVSYFQNMSSHEAIFSTNIEGSIRKLTSKFYYNNSKFEQILKQIVIQKSMKGSQNSRKSSCDTTDSCHKVNLYQFYDSQFDITVLSSSDFGENSCQQIYLDIGKQPEPQDEEFQILIEETDNDDQRFLKNNLDLFKELCL